jgi:hypothetical protein
MGLYAIFVFLEWSVGVYASQRLPIILFVVSLEKLAITFKGWMKLEIRTLKWFN